MSDVLIVGGGPVGALPRFPAAAARRCGAGLGKADRTECPHQGHRDPSAGARRAGAHRRCPGADRPGRSDPPGLRREQRPQDCAHAVRSGLPPVPVRPRRTAARYGGGSGAAAPGAGRRRPAPGRPGDWNARRRRPGHAQRHHCRGWLQLLRRVRGGRRRCLLDSAVASGGRGAGETVSGPLPDG
jgi:hypothetical protein